MKKLLGVFLLILTGCLLFGSAVLCQDKYHLQSSADKIGYNVKPEATVYNMSALVINILLSALALAFFGLMLYSGFRWMTAMGKEEDVTKAKDTITSAIIGLVVISLAYAISLFVMSALNPAPNVQELPQYTSCTVDTDCSGSKVCINTMCVDNRSVSCADFLSSSECAASGHECAWQTDPAYSACVKTDTGALTMCEPYDNRERCEQESGCEWGYCDIAEETELDLRSACNFDGDCVDTSLSCIGGRCVAGTGVVETPQCLADRDCRDDQTCVDNVCIVPAVGEMDLEEEPATAPATPAQESLTVYGEKYCCKTVDYTMCILNAPSSPVPTSEEEIARINADVKRFIENCLATHCTLGSCSD